MFRKKMKNGDEMEKRLIYEDDCNANEVSKINRI